MAILINAYCTDRNPPPLDFPHQLSSRRDRSDPELAGYLDREEALLLSEALPSLALSAAVHVDEKPSGMTPSGMGRSKSMPEQSPIISAQPWWWLASCVLAITVGVRQPAEAQLPQWPEGFDKSAPFARTLYETGSGLGVLTLYRRELRSYPPGLEGPIPKDHPLGYIHRHIFFLVAAPPGKLGSRVGVVPWLVYMGEPGNITLGGVVWNKYRQRAYVTLLTSLFAGRLIVRVYEVDPAVKLATFPMTFDLNRAAEWPKPSKPLVEAWRSLRGSTDKPLCRGRGEYLIKRLSVMTGEDRIVACGRRDLDCEDICFSYDLVSKEWLDLVARPHGGAPVFRSMRDFGKR